MKNLLLLFTFLLIVSCKENAEEEYSSAVMYSPARDEASKQNLISDSESEISPKIVKTGIIRFETSDLEKTNAQIQEAVKKYKASIEKNIEGKNDYSVYRKITIRIPNQNFEDFITAIGKGVSYFDEKEISASDVTAEYIDTEARLKTKRTLETRYLQLLDKASKVSEILEIEKELSAIREEIESKEGQLKYLQSQVAMSSVQLEFYKKSPSESGVTQSYGSKMGNALESGFIGISSFFLWILNVWPFILILVVLFFIIRRKFKRKKA